MKSSKLVCKEAYPTFFKVNTFVLEPWQWKIANFNNWLGVIMDGREDIRSLVATHVYHNNVELTKLIKLCVNIQHLTLKFMAFVLYLEGLVPVCDYQYKTPIEENIEVLCLDKIIGLRRLKVLTLILIHYEGWRRRIDVCKKGADAADEVKRSWVEKYDEDLDVVVKYEDQHGVEIQD